MLLFLFFLIFLLYDVQLVILGRRNLLRSLRNRNDGLQISRAYIRILSWSGINTLWNLQDLESNIKIQKYRRR